MRSLSASLALLATATVAFGTGCIVRFEDDDDDHVYDPGDPEILDADAWCNDDLTTWTLWADVDDHNGQDDVASVRADAFSVYQDDSEEFETTLHLQYDGEGEWSTEVPSEYTTIDCTALDTTYCFDFSATDYDGRESDVYVVCN